MKSYTAVECTVAPVLQEGATPMSKKVLSPSAVISCEVFQLQSLYNAKLQAQSPILLVTPRVRDEGGDVSQAI